jgi:ferrochelatase
MINLDKPKSAGLLLINLGTPDAPTPEAVERYLKQFLMDKWVIDLPWVWRWILVNMMIVPRRKNPSSQLYRSIWTERGSPLLVHTQDLASEVVRRAGDGLKVAIAMRYGSPSIAEGLARLLSEGVDEVTVFPLYPQYAESTTRSSVEECERVLNYLNSEASAPRARMKVIKPFYDRVEYLDAMETVIRESLSAAAAALTSPSDHMLFTFHGLPVKHLRRTDGGRGVCYSNESCCAEISARNQNCYRAQCLATARALAKRLGLKNTQWSVAFQSRIGRGRWIEPYTDEILARLAHSGVKRLFVAAPSFTADCLETLEEISARGSKLFKAAGGEEMIVAPCLNSHPAWAKAVLNIAQRPEN